MKKTVLYLLLAALLFATTGCANGPVRRFLCGKLCTTCQPASEPSFGFGSDDSAWSSGDGHCVNCVDGNYGGSAPTYLGEGDSDPYVQGSYYGGASINPPVFDSYSGPGYGSTIVPPGSSGILPNPNGQ